MRIEGSGKTSPVKGVKKTDKKKKSDSADFDGMVDQTTETSGKKPVTGTTAIHQIDALLTIQEAEDGTSEEAQRRARQRAEIILEKLDQLRFGLLTGGIPKSSLQQLTTMVSTHRVEIMDPALREILDEIDLRAQVELAKHSRET